MYSKTADDLQTVFDIIDAPLPEGQTFRNWEEITKILNEHFGVVLNKRQWKNQYETGKARLLRTGSAAQTTDLGRANDVMNNQNKKEDSTITLVDQKIKLRKYLAKPKMLNEIVKYLKVDEITAMGLIHSLKVDNYIISYNKSTEQYSLEKTLAVVPQTYVHSIGKVTEIEFLVISDSHWCTKIQQKSFVDFIYAEANRRGIKNVYHVGDIVDGYYKSRPEQIYELIAIGADEQKDYIVANWPYYPGITTHLIIGNHDETHIKNGGFNIGAAIAKERKDINYLGIGHAKIMLTPNCRMDLFHPLDGSAYAVSYSGQKYMDSITGGDKPNILFVGHHHKAMYFLYRNIHYFETPSMTQQSSWMKRKRIANESGAWFIKLKVDEQGTIVSLIPEFIKQYKFLENDY